MIKIIRSQDEIDVLHEIEKQYGSYYCRIKFSDDFFREARNIFLNKDTEGCFSAVCVTDEYDQELFYIKYIEDTFDYAGNHSKNVEINYDGKNLLEYLDCIDFSILEGYDTYFISEINEYTYEIIKLLNCVYPKAKVIVSDCYAKLFNNINVISANNYMDARSMVVGKTVFIFSSMKNTDMLPILDYVVNVYSCIKVMANLCWAINRDSYGTEYSDKTFLVIDYDPKLKMGGMGGINAIISDVVFYVKKALLKGWVPIVYLTNTQYISSKVTNTWDCYFKQYSEYKFEDIQKAANVIEGKKNKFTWTPQILLDNEDCSSVKVELCDSMKEYISKYMPDTFHNKNRILGVIARGSDLKKATQSEFSIEEFVDYVKDKLVKGGFDYIFLATEEQKYLDMFQKEFDSKLIFINQKRISYDYDNKPYKLVADLFQMNDDNRVEFGSKYIMITFLLSKCDALISTINSGATNLARRWRNKPYEFDVIFCNPNRTRASHIHKDLLISQKKIQNFILSKEKIIIYAIGKDTRKYILNDISVVDKLIYCDKAAQTKEMYFRGKKVISPSDIIDKYISFPVLIASTQYENEICNELLDMGCKANNIFKLSEFVI